VTVNGTNLGSVPEPRITVTVVITNVTSEMSTNSTAVSYANRTDSNASVAPYAVSDSEVIIN